MRHLLFPKFVPGQLPFPAVHRGGHIMDVDDRPLGPVSSHTAAISIQSHVVGPSVAPLLILALWTSNRRWATQTVFGDHKLCLVAALGVFISNHLVLVSSLSYALRLSRATHVWMPSLMMVCTAEAISLSAPALWNPHRISPRPPEFVPMHHLFRDDQADLHRAPDFGRRALNTRSV